MTVLPIKAIGTRGKNYFLQNFGKDLRDDVTHTLMCVHTLTHTNTHANTQTHTCTHTHTNSKHWFTTSFLQPLPYLVTSYVAENCQLMSSFSLVLKQK